MNEHQSTKKTDKPVAEQFSLPGHNLTDPRVAGFRQQGFKNELEQKIAEQKTIQA